MGRATRGGRIARCGAASVLAVMFALACAGVASAAPSMSLSPANGEVVRSTDVTVTVVATDTTPFMLWSQFKLDNGSWAMRITPTADRKQLTLTARFTGLKEGAHSAMLWLMNAQGAVSSRTWSFSVEIPPQVLEFVPAPGSHVDTLTPTVSVRLADASGISGTPTLTVDGLPVAASWNPSTKTVSFKPSIGWSADQTRTVEVRATDTRGNSVVRTWTFVPHSAAAMRTDDCLVCHQGFPMAAGHPFETASCFGCHERLGNNHEYDPSACRACHSPHLKSYLSAYPCARCHPDKPGGAHSAAKTPLHATPADGFAGCRSCHESQLTREHTRYLIAGKAMDCKTCHGSGARAAVTAAVTAGDTRCGACHDFSGSGAEVHRAAHDFEPDPACAECHDANLADEHLASRQSCATCHGSSNPAVAAAITAGDTSCATCHEGMPHSLEKSFCYTCHTDAVRTFPGFATAEVHGHQSGSPYGTWGTYSPYVPGSPVGFPNCVQCHKGHKATRVTTAGDELCYQCHTTGLENAYWDPWETGNQVPFQWPSKTTYERTEHRSGPGRTEVIKGDKDFGAISTHDGTQYSNGALTMVPGRNFVEGMPAVISPPPTSGPADLGTVITTWSGWNRFLYTTYDNWYWVATTIDLGSQRSVNGARVQSGNYVDMASIVGQAVHVYTSDDNITWTFRGGTGQQGVGNKDLRTYFTPVTARYVRVYTGAYKQANSDSSAPGWEINLNRVEVHEPVPSATWTSDVRDISQEGTASLARLEWVESVPQGAEQTVAASISFDGGATWTPYAALTNGGTIPDIVGHDITNARIRYRVSMKTNAQGAAPTLTSLTARFSRATGNALTTYPGTGAETGSCANCHDPHGTPGSGSTRAVGNELCYGCHDSAAVSREADFTYRGRDAFAASGHGQKRCAECHAPHGWADNYTPGANTPAMLDGSSYYGEYGVCMKCHNTAANSANGVNISQRLGLSSDHRTRHNLYPGEWYAANTRLECSDCHPAHIATGDAPLRDPDTLGEMAKTQVDPFRNGRTIFADKDTGIFENYPQGTNGAGTTIQVTAQNAGAGPSMRRSMLVHFPLESIPSTWTISSAKIIFYANTYLGRPMNWELAPLTHSFEEGSGYGPLHYSRNVGGATWWEWKYGNEWWTGSEAEDWHTMGGDIDTSTVLTDNSGGKYIVFENATALVNKMRQHGNAGLLLSTPGDTYTSLQNVYSSESAYRPVLELTFADAPQRPIPDMAAFCMRCHDGSTPRDVKLGTATWNVPGWNTDAHGFGVGVRAGAGMYDAYGDMRAPFAYNSPPLGCQLCHDPHGSSSQFHLTSLDGKTTYNIAADGTGAKQFCQQCHELPWHAGHDQAAAGYDPANWDKCFNCHGHGRNDF